MRIFTLKRLLAAGGVVLFAAGLYVADKTLSRPDRILHSRRLGDLMEVRDQILRYEYEQGGLPPSLEATTPTYLAENQLRAGDKKLYRYDPAGRVIAMAAGTPVRGLFNRVYPPESIVMPLPSKSGGGGLKECEDAAGPEAAKILEPHGGADEAEPPAGSYVFEAEHYTESNYGWEVTPDASSGGGAYVHIKEGMANGPGQREYEVGDYYNIGDVRDICFMRYNFHLPKSGKYYAYVRMWTTGSHCSNAVNIGLDSPAADNVYVANYSPFRWVWTRMGGSSPEQIEAGDHYLEFFPHEDGERLDQIIFSTTKIAPDAGAFKANLATADGTAFAAGLTSPVALSFDYPTMVFSPEHPPQGRVALRRLRDCAGKATLALTLEGARRDGGELSLCRYELELAKLPALSFVDIDFRKAALKGLRRREYLLRADLLLDGKVSSSCHVPLIYPLAWQVTGMFPYYSNGTAGPCDAAAEPGPEQPAGWSPFKEECYDHFGVFDFGLQTSGNSLQAPVSKTIYVQTEIFVTRRAKYLLKLQSDDQMLLWIDGRFATRIDSTRPVTRSPKRYFLIFTPGKHTLRLRVNQGRADNWGDGRWQACLRIRTEDDKVSDVFGLPLPEGDTLPDLARPGN